MFTNPETIWIEALVLLAIVAFFAFLIARYAYKKAHHLPTGDCACCHKGKKPLLDEYYKAHPHKE